MNKLDETAVEYFDDTEHKAFLLDVIDVLEKHNHVSKQKIDDADKKHGLVWNWLNTAAKSFSVDKVIKVLQMLNLLENKHSIDKTLIKEALDPAVRSAKRKEKAAEKQILLQIQSISLDSITEHILEKIPSAKWVPFKNSIYYTGKITYEANTGFAELWYRSDGMIVASLNDGSRHQCYTEEMLWDWINKQGYASSITAEQPLQITDLDDTVKFITSNYDTLGYVKFKKTDKVYGKIEAKSKNDYDYSQLWFRTDGSIGCTSPKGRSVTCTTMTQLVKWLDNNCKRNNSAQNTTSQLTQTSVQPQDDSAVEDTVNVSNTQTVANTVSTAKRAKMQTKKSSINFSDLIKGI